MLRFNSFALSFLTGIGLFSFAANANLTVSPSSVYFFGTVVGQSASPQYVNITNNGPDVVQRVQVQGGCYGDFNVISQCYSPLSQYQSCQMLISFRPTFPGHKFCSVSISSERGDFVSVSVQGEATPQPTPRPMPTPRPR